MITIFKLKEYEEYHGYYDGFYMQKVKNGINVTNDDEWYLIGSLIQDARLVNKGLASKEFSDNLYKKLKENCDNDDTINELKNLADKEW
ncbi:MAG: hypothetical protein WDO14_18115 [Bacteroidota bacterium]